MQQLQQKMSVNKNKNDDLNSLEQRIKIMREHIKNQQDDEKDTQENERY